MVGVANRIRVSARRSRIRSAGEERSGGDVTTVKRQGRCDREKRKPMRTVIG
jgi:hypothetical protein